MSGPFGSSQWMYSSGGFYPQEIEQSLRFNDDDSAYLSWTPASAGNRKTWTWSGWVKRGNLTTTALFGSRPSGSNPNFLLRFDSSSRIDVQWNDGTTGNSFTTSAVYRDPSAWYHIVFASDTTLASDRYKIYVNGEQITSFDFNNPPSQNTELTINSSSYPHFIGLNNGFSQYGEYYLAEVNFIDGQALDPTDFGEFKSGVWVAKEYTGSYGTNGFYLPFKQTTVANGFNTVTYSGNGGTQSIEGTGFSPDFVWIKSRSGTTNHLLFDSVRGINRSLNSNSTGSEDTTSTNKLTSFDADGFSLGDNSGLNNSGQTYVGWCWDAGSGSPASNTDGSITSTVKANTDYGFSVVSYTGTGSSATVGHGLGVAPDMIIAKSRTNSTQWRVWHKDFSSGYQAQLNLTDAPFSDVNVFTTTVPTSSVFSIGTSSQINVNTYNYIAYCFAEISGYSSFSSYSGTGASGNTITTGFKPAFLMIKRTDSANDWQMFDGTRNTSDPRVSRLKANDSVTEADFSTGIDFTDTGFEVNDTSVSINSASGTYIYMAFADTRDAAFWRDLSGNDNTWQPNALQNSDVMPDSPTNNFCTLNPLDVYSADLPSFAEGNLKFTVQQVGQIKSTFAVSSGKFYWEVLNSSDLNMGGLVKSSVAQNNTYGGQMDARVSYGSVAAANDIIRFRADFDAGTFEYAVNNGAFTTSGISGSITAGEEYKICFSRWDVEQGADTANFGQDSSFAGNKTAQGNTDDNGVGDFYYAPPSGYLALCTANLPDPAIDPAQDDVPADYFNTVLYTGTGAAQSISVGFQPDLTLLKNRTNAFGGSLYDAVRGAGLRLGTPSTDAEIDYTSSFISFDTGGFSIAGGNGEVNQTSAAFVAWNWLAGNGTSSNTDGSITSTVSVNQKAGFSIVSYTGTGSNATVGHGLGAAPSMVIVKRRDSSTNGDWFTYHESLGNTDAIYLNLTNATSGSAGAWNNTSPTSSVFTIGTSTGVNASSSTYIAYCFAEVEGYSKFGSYTGNGSNDGPFIYCGFRPSLFLTKRTDSTSDWQLLDTSRDTYNAADAYLKPNTSGAEATGGPHDFVSNGFKIRNTGGSQNASGGTYIFMAFAENPFKYANAR